MPVAWAPASPTGMAPAAAPRRRWRPHPVIGISIPRSPAYTPGHPTSSALRAGATRSPPARPPHRPLPPGFHTRPSPSGALLVTRPAPGSPPSCRSGRQRHPRRPTAFAAGLPTAGRCPALALFARPTAALTRPRPSHLLGARPAPRRRRRLVAALGVAVGEGVGEGKSRAACRRARSGRRSRKTASPNTPPATPSASRPRRGRGGEASRSGEMYIVAEVYGAARHTQDTCPNRRIVGAKHSPNYPPACPIPVARMLRPHRPGAWLAASHTVIPSPRAVRPPESS